MSNDAPKAYSPAGIESRIYQTWLERGCFHAAPEDTTHPPHKPAYSIVIPPPNVTGALHLGHAINNTLQDILVRRKRMQGCNTLWMPGVDHAGIATQAVVERQLFEQEKKTRHDVGRDELVRRIWQWKEQYGDRIVRQLQLMGCSCDWQRQRFTLDDVCARAVREWFFRMFRDGLIFRGKRLVNWDTHLQTAVADDEVYHETVKGHLWHVRYPIEERHQGEKKGTGNRELGTEERHEGEKPRDSLPWAAGVNCLVVATTRPETMLADTAVAVHPEDERYRLLIGRRVVLPLTGRTIPIIADGLLVKREFGTGCVKVTPGHDPNDYACYQRHPEIGIRNMMTPDGRVNDENAGEGGKYAGLKLEAARKQIVADLDAAGLLEKVEDYQTDIGHSDRSKTPIQPYLSDQWFVKMGDVEGGVRMGDGSTSSGLAQAALDAICDDDAHYDGPNAVASRANCAKVHIFPRRYVNTYRDWLSEKRDWCISRQLWWGHRIPVWTRANRYSGAMDSREVERRRQTLPVIERRVGRKSEDWCHRVVNIEPPAGFPVTEGFEFVSVRTGTEEEYRSTFQDLGFALDPDVLDTWFSSALWPLSTMGWPGGTSSEPNRDREGAPGNAPDRSGGAISNSGRECSESDRAATAGGSAALPHGRGSDQEGARGSENGSGGPRHGNTATPEFHRRTSHPRTPQEGAPLAYFITFRTYGTWLHGDARGSVARGQDEPGMPLLDPNERREYEEFQRLKHAPVTLDATAREIVDRTVREVCAHRKWEVHELNVRSNHVHIVVSGPSMPEKMMNDFKAWATRRLKESAGGPTTERTWARHGSTLYLWTEDAVAQACQYVREHQGDDSHTNPNRDREGAPGDAPDRSGGAISNSGRECSESDRAATEGGSAALPHGRGSDQGGGQSASERTATEDGSAALPHGRGSDQEGALGSDKGGGASIVASMPEPDLLNVFYPTSVLSTAREIITLWVARMVIAGLYNVGKVPFRDVVIHPVIQDGQGRPMKKTLGNGVDPVDIIDLYGADALRFTLAGMATETQDIRVPVKKSRLPDGREVNTSEKFELGRNFCNKLWQAATGYILPNVEGVCTKRHHGQWHTRALPHELPLFDRWIRTRLNACIRDVDAALESYQFARAADRVRDFFWTEFCDWYIEESKLRIRGEGGHDVKIVLLQTLDITLALLHPIVPFITEALWEEIGRRMPHHAELVDDGAGDGPRLLIQSPWPQPCADFDDPACERAVEEVIRPLITALRQAKTDINLARARGGQPAIKTLPQAVVHADAATCALVTEHEALVRRLGGADALTIGADAAKPHQVRSHVEERFQVYVPLAGLVDLAIESKRLRDELNEKQAALARARAQLANESFVSRAAPETVQQARDRAAEMERQCRLIEGHLADLA